MTILTIHPVHSILRLFTFVKNNTRVIEECVICYYVEIWLRPSLKVELEEQEKITKGQNAFMPQQIF